MKKIKVVLALFVLSSILLLVGCAQIQKEVAKEQKNSKEQENAVIEANKAVEENNNPDSEDEAGKDDAVGKKDEETQKSTGSIYLYGETHGVKQILEKELEIWGEAYKNGKRDLFVELPYYTAEYLNLWMKADNDDIMDALYEDWKGSALYNEEIKAFYQSIKAKFPESVFHGTDVGHQYQTTGKRYLEYLESDNKKDSIEYRITLEVIEQGKKFYKANDFGYREDKMVENFIREFDDLKDRDIVGIYGSVHTDVNGLAYRSDKNLSMANQLNQRYGEKLLIQDLTGLEKEMEALKKDRFVILNKQYEVSYFGEQDISNFTKDFTKREFYRVENAYDDFAKYERTGDVLPIDNYPVSVSKGDVFVIDYHTRQNTIKRTFYICDGKTWNGRIVTEEFVISEGQK